MKKIMLCAAAFAVLCMVSCGTSKKSVSVMDF